MLRTPSSGVLRSGYFFLGIFIFVSTKNSGWGWLFRGMADCFGRNALKLSFNPEPADTDADENGCEKVFDNQ